MPTINTQIITGGACILTPKEVPNMNRTDMDIGETNIKLTMPVTTLCITLDKPFSSSRKHNLVNSKNSHHTDWL